MSEVGRYVWSENYHGNGRRRIHINFCVRENGTVRIGCELVALKAPYSSCDHPWETPDDAIPCAGGCFSHGRLREWNEACEQAMAGGDA